MLLQHPLPPPHQPLVDLRGLVKSPCISPFLEDPLLPPIIMGMTILRVSATTRADAFPSARNETLFLFQVACVQMSPLPQEKSGEETSVNRRR